MDSKLEEYIEEHRGSLEAGSGFYPAVFGGLSDHSKAIIDQFAPQTLEKALQSLRDDDWPTKNGAAELSQAYSVMDYLVGHSAINDGEAKIRLAAYWENAVRTVGRHSLQVTLQKAALPLIDRHLPSLNLCARTD